MFSKNRTFYCGVTGRSIDPTDGYDCPTDKAVILLLIEVQNNYKREG